ncbi:MAG: VWA domain-containing protein [Bacteroidales bacterium]|jgi:Ca-activated chloride channel family protein|nr:VWA domain-containing protein [Bacteroidales bacterium]
MNYTFANPQFFWLFAVWAATAGWYIWRQNRLSPHLQVTSVEGLKGVLTARPVLRHGLFVLRMIAFALIIAVLARPQSSNQWESVTTEGIDIVMTLDISGTMLAQDFKPDRLEAAKKVAVQFISGRPNDRIGLVIFSGESFTQCPLTTDHTALINLFSGVHSGMIEDGTAIGLGLANAVNRIRDSDAVSKVIILLTDGVNNRGSIDPMTAAEIAKTFGIRVYTIGVGSRGTAPYPLQTPLGVRYQDMETQIDEDLLKNIAQMTDGLYFRATDNDHLKKVYEEIDRLEKSKISVQEHHKKSEEYLKFAVAAALLLLLEILLRYTVLRHLP